MKTAIIIGGGPAGLTAAYKLLKETDIVPIIIEKETFVGGIARTAFYKGNRMDIGGHRFFTKDEDVMALWQELMPLMGAPALDDIILNRDVETAEGGPDPEKEDRVFLIRNRVSRIFYLHKFFDYPISMRPQTFINMGFFRTVAAGFGYIWSCIFKRPENNLEDFYINRFGKPLYNMFFKNYTTKVWGREPKDIGADWGAQRVKGLSLRKAIADAFRKFFGKKDAKNTETSLIESFYYPKFGPGQLWDVLLSEIESMGGKIIFGAEAVAFDTQNNKISSVTIKTKEGEQTMEADYFISSMPIKDLVASLGDAVSDEKVRDAAKHLPYRDFITVGVLAKKMALKNKTNIKTLSDIVPDTWIYVQEDDVLVGRLQIFNNWSPYMVKDPVGTVWIGMEYFVSEGDAYWNMEDNEFIQLATDELVKIGVLDKEDILDTCRFRVQKAYPAYFDSYKDIDIIRQSLDQFENLYCIGRNGQHRYNNMDHSMLTAMEAVKMIQNGITDKTALWSVNTEKEYHEEKKS